MKLHQVDLHTGNRERSLPSTGWISCMSSLYMRSTLLHRSRQCCTVVSAHRASVSARRSGVAELADGFWAAPDPAAGERE